MGAGRKKKGPAWPETPSTEDTDIRAHTANLIKDLKALKKHHKTIKALMPRERSAALLDTLLTFAQRVHNAPTTKTLTQRLARVKSYIEKTQKEVSQASHKILTTKSNTNRLMKAICALYPQGRAS